MDVPKQPVPDNAHPPEQVTLSQAFWYWLKLGFISFGGPAGQIAIMHQDLVERMRWISERRFLHALNYCMMLPVQKPSSLRYISVGCCTTHGVELLLEPCLYCLLYLF